MKTRNAFAGVHRQARSKSIGVPKTERMLPHRRRLAAELLEHRLLLSVDPWPAALEAEDPLGSLIYDSSVSADIAAPAENDGFTIDLDDGQTITAVVDPDAALQPTVELFDPSSVSIGGATAGAAGEDAVLQTVPTIGAGTYTVTVGGAGGTTGSYTVQVILNAAVEEEEHDGPPNDDAASAQDLDASFIALGAASAQRGAVLAALSSSEDWYSFTLDDGQTATLALKALTAGAVTLELHQSGPTLLAWGVAAENVDQAINNFVDTTIDGGPNTYFARVTGDPGAEYTLVVTGNADFDTEPNDALWATPQEITRSGGVLGRLHVGLKEEKLTASNAASGDYFGGSVSISGGVAIVGAYRDYDVGADSGSAYVFRFDGSQWVEAQKLTASDAASDDYFGGSVSISGDTAIVGAYGNDDAGSDSGSAYVFRFDGSQWVEDQKLTASDTASGDYFGRSVSVSGDVAIVGAFHNNDAGTNSGSAYVFRFDGSQWIEEGKLTASDAASDDYFGGSVSISGEVAIVGASGNSDAGSDSGSAYVFRFDGSQWVEAQKLTASDAASNDYFGGSVSISADLAIVGADWNNDAGSNSGSAYVFRFDGSQWIEEEKLTASDAASDDCFGHSVSISGDLAIVGAYCSDDAGTNSGSAYVFRFDGSRWVEAQKLTASDAASYDVFGSSVSISGDVAIVGAPGNDDAGSLSGSAYVIASARPDDYAVSVEAGNTVVLTTHTVADGPAEFQNLLDPAIELYDPSGTLVGSDDNSAPDGRNAELTHGATATGPYTARVLTSATHAGEYVLQVSGHTGTPPLFMVTDTNPAHGEILASAPTTFTVNFSDTVLTSTLDASDLTINGSLTATGFELLDGDTVRFDLPALDQRLHAVAIALGAILDLQGTQIESFSSQFEVTQVIDVGNHVLLADTPGQQIQIYIAGGAATVGMDLNVQIGDGGPEAGGVIDGPVITDADMVIGTIFQENHSGVSGGPTFPQLYAGTINTQAGTVDAEGLLVTLTIDTSGFSEGTWGLSLSDTLNGPTALFSEVPQPIPLAIIDGTIYLNQPPVARIDSIGSVTENLRGYDEIQLDGSNSSDPDPGDTIVSYEWDLDEDGVFGETGPSAERGDELGSSVWAWPSGLDGDYDWPVQLRVEDSHGDTHTADHMIWVENLPPIFVIWDYSGEVDEGEEAWVGGEVDDNRMDILTVDINWGDGTPTYTIGDHVFWGEHIYGDDGEYDVLLAAYDDDGGYSPRHPSIQVHNVPPSLTNLGVTSPIDVGDNATLTGTIVDPGALDTFTLVVDWGDDTPPETFPHDGPYPAGTTGFSEQHTYAAPGRYLITLTLTDDDGGSDSDDSLSVTVTGGEILGTIWNDVNGDGAQDAETGIDGVSVTLYLDDGDGLFEPGGDDAQQGTELTAGGGGYVFSALGPGDYWVDVDYTTVPLANFVPTWGKDPLFAPLAAGQDHVADFGFREHTGPFVVTTLDDENDGDYTIDDVSLREALLLAAVLPGDDAIQFGAAMSGTITLDPALGQLRIDSNVDIQGLGADQLLVDANGNSRALYIFDGVTATVGGLTVTGGAGNVGGGIRNQGKLTIINGAISGNVGYSAGGIYNVGELTLLQSVLEDNRAGNERGSEGGPGGAVLNDGMLRIIDCTISGNSAPAFHGGGVYSSGTLNISHSTIFRNSTGSTYWGGGICSFGDMTITDSLIAENSADRSGGGIYSQGTLIIANSTISANTTHIDGGGVWNGGTLTIVNSTISGNGGSSGGIFNGGLLTLINTTVTENEGLGIDTVLGTTTLFNTIVAGNALDDVDGPLDPDSSHNFIGSRDGHPVLGPLADNGGPTPTHALLPGSPAIDAGSNLHAVNAGLTYDQRGFYRFLDGNADGTATVDIGAYEASGCILVTTAVDENDGNIFPDNLSLREALSLAAAQPGDDCIRFDGSLAGSTIVLDPALGHLRIDSNVDVQGLGADQLTVDAAGNSRVFYVSSGVVAAISGLTISGGATQFGGGGISNLGDLSLANATVSGNWAERGGGVYNTGALTISQSSFSGNQTYPGQDGDVGLPPEDVGDVGDGGDGGDGGHGGGIYNWLGDVEIIGSTLTGNRTGSGGSGGDVLDLGNPGSGGSGGSGGGIWSSGGTVTITSSTLSDNSTGSGGEGGWNWGGAGGGGHGGTAGGGGAISADVVTITNSTLSGNSTGRGGDGTFASSMSSGGDGGPGGSGGAIGGGTISITNSTLSDNSTGSGGDGGSDAEYGGRGGYGGAIIGDTVTITNSTLSGNSTGDGGYGGNGDDANGGSGGSGGYGGGVYAGTLTITNSELSGNSTGNGGDGGDSEYGGGDGGYGGSGGGIKGGTVTITNCTLSGNSTGDGGAGGDGSLEDGQPGGPGTGGGIHAAAALYNTIVANNSPDDVSGSLDPASSHNLIGNDPSSAIDAGSNQRAIDAGLTFDLQGVYRFLDGDGNGTATVDIGAYEASGCILVTTAVDENDGNIFPDNLSLREALSLAAAQPGDDCIRFDGSLAGSTIVLDPALGQLELDSNVDVQGLGADQLTVDAAGNSRVFYVSSGVVAAISRLTISGGRKELLWSGAGIVNYGELTVDDVRISGNIGLLASAGGIYNAGTLAIIDSTISNNSGFGGGVLNHQGTLTITRTIISGNSGYLSAPGSGICSLLGTMTVINSTISANSAQSDGGGIYNSGNMTIVNTTVFGNSAGSGGGICSDPAGIATVYNTIVAGNSPDDIDGPLDPASSHNLIGGDPKLGPLADNGGSTLTHALMPGSPAIDNGSNPHAANAELTQDQRGLGRFDGHENDGGGIYIVDVGACEAILGGIRGGKWKDLDADGDWDQPGEPGIADWQIYVDLDYNGQWDPGEPDAQTDAEGNYTFDHLAPGAYAVAEGTRDGWQQTSPDFGSSIERLPIAPDGSEGDDASLHPSISADGRFVAFRSAATNLVPEEGDTNQVDDVFVYDRQTDTVERVSLAWNGSQANGPSYWPCISADGRWVTFISEATNLVEAEDDNGAWDIFVFDRQEDAIERVSQAADGSVGNAESTWGSISADGRYVAYESAANNLVEGDDNGVRDVFVHDRQAGTTQRVSLAGDGSEGDGHSRWPSISAHGRYVAFRSTASNLVPGDEIGNEDVFVYDRLTRIVQRVSLAWDGSEGNGDSYHPLISADGRYVAFVSEAANLVPGDNNLKRDIFVCDRQNDSIERVSAVPDGPQGDGDSDHPSISADGRYVAFVSAASNLVPEDDNFKDDIFVYDRDTASIERVSVASGGSEGDDYSRHASISADGRYVAFYSSAQNLAPGDGNEVKDVFVNATAAAATRPGTHAVVLEPGEITEGVNFGNLETTLIDVVLIPVLTPSAPSLPGSAPPEPYDMVAVGSTYYLEVWVQDVGLPAAGVSGGYVDIHYTTDFVNPTAVINEDFDLFPTGTIHDPNGLVDDLGGATLSGGVGVAPDWVRLAYVELVATDRGEVTFELSSGDPQFARFGAGNVDWAQVDLGDVVTVSQIASLRVDTRLVSHPTDFEEATTGEVGSLPDSEVWIDEWESYWVEIWVSTPETDNIGVYGGTIDLEYAASYATADSIQWGPAFTENRRGTIDDGIGLVDDVGAETTRSDVGDDAYALLARIRFVPSASDQAPVDEVGHFIGPYHLGLALDDDQLALAGIGPVDGEFGPAPPTDLWAVVYDVDDSDHIDLGDFSYFAAAFGRCVGEPEPPFIWWADFDETGCVDVGDLSYFAPNFRKTKPDHTVSFPPTFPGAWAAKQEATEGLVSHSVVRLEDSLGSFIFDTSLNVDIAGAVEAEEFLLDVVLIPVLTPTSTTPPGEPLPTAVDTVPVGSTYYLEVWVQDIGLPAAGVSGGYVDVHYTTDFVNGTAVINEDFDLFPTGAIGDANGLVDDLGGATLSGGIGVASDWARLGYVELVAEDYGEVTFELSSGDPQFARFGSGNVPWSQVDLSDVVTVNQVPRVVGCYVFYNNSAFDGNDPAAGPEDDDAIASDKEALLPGGTATFANYTSFSSGINGVMIDVMGLPSSTIAQQALSADDFEFRMGNSNDPDTWAEAPGPSIVEVRPGAGVDDSHRVTLIWPNYSPSDTNSAVAKQWLQVVMKADLITGLSEPDTFYFGNAIGESGNSVFDAHVNAIDMLSARDNPRTFLDPAPIDFFVDFNRDTRVNAIDMLIARENSTHFLNALKLITVPGGKAHTTGTGGRGRPDMDAVFEPPASRAASSRATAWADLDWLYEFEPPSRSDQPVAEENTTEQAGTGKTSTPAKPVTCREGNPAIAC